MRYSAQFKAQMVERVLALDAPPVAVLAREHGLGKNTLYTWKSEALQKMGKRKNQRRKRRPGDRSPIEKMRLVLASEGLEGQALGEFLRKEGVHLSDLEAWKALMLDGLGPEKPSESEKQAVAELKEARRELKRKEAALAETAALLVLSKKARRLLGDADDTTTGKPDSSSWNSSEKP